MKVSCALISFFTTLSWIQCASPHGYVKNTSLGVGYKLMYQSKAWPDAREACEQDGARLAVPKTHEEFEFIQKLVRAMHHPSITDSDYKLLVWLGINNLDDYRTWKNIDGEDIEEVGFHRWSGTNGQGHSDAPEEPHCAGIDAVNPGLRDYWCHRRQPFICQINF